MSPYLISMPFINEMLVVNGYDYQNTIRPTYFLFKLLSRLTGNRLRIDSDSDTVHALATWDDTYRLYNLLVWNFSPSPVSVNLKLENPPYNLKVKPIVLDSLTPNNDENVRLKPGTPLKLDRRNARMTIAIESYGVHFYYLEQ